MFIAAPQLLPGHGFKEFTIHTQGVSISKTGRPQKKSPEEKYNKVFFGALIKASQKEIDQWKQNGHPITHKIIAYGAKPKARPTDYLVTDDTREFYVQGRNNPGDLNVTMVYYVEERLDMKKVEAWEGL